MDSFSQTNRSDNGYTLSGGYAEPNSVAAVGNTSPGPLSGSGSCLTGGNDAPEEPTCTPVSVESVEGTLRSWWGQARQSTQQLANSINNALQRPASADNAANVGNQTANAGNQAAYMSNQAANEELRRELAQALSQQASHYQARIRELQLAINDLSEENATLRRDLCQLQRMFEALSEEWRETKRSLHANPALRLAPTERVATEQQRDTDPWKEEPSPAESQLGYSAVEGSNEVRADSAETGDAQLLSASQCQQIINTLSIINNTRTRGDLPVDVYRQIDAMLLIVKEIRAYHLLPIPGRLPTLVAQSKNLATRLLPDFFMAVCHHASRSNRPKMIAYMTEQGFAMLKGLDMELINPAPQDDTDESRHMVSSTVPADDPSQRGKVANCLCPGLIVRGAVYAPAEITLFT